MLDGASFYLDLDSSTVKFLHFKWAALKLHAAIPGDPELFVFRGHSFQGRRAASASQIAFGASFGSRRPEPVRALSIPLGEEIFAIPSRWREWWSTRDQGH